MAQEEVRQAAHGLIRDTPAETAARLAHQAPRQRRWDPLSRYGHQLVPWAVSNFIFPPAWDSAARRHADPIKRHVAVDPIIKKIRDDTGVIHVAAPRTASGGKRARAGTAERPTSSVSGWQRAFSAHEPRRGQATQRNQSAAAGVNFKRR